MINKLMNLWDLLVSVICLAAIVGICFKFFILHEVSFLTFILGLIFLGGAGIVSLFGFRGEISTMDDILQRKPLNKRGDIALNIFAIITGAFSIYKALSDSQNKSSWWLCGILFFGGGIFQLGSILKKQDKA